MKTVAWMLGALMVLNGYMLFTNWQTHLLWEQNNAQLGQIWDFANARCIAGPGTRAIFR